MKRISLSLPLAGLSVLLTTTGCSVALDTADDDLASGDDFGSDASEFDGGIEGEEELGGDDDSGDGNGDGDGDDDGNSEPDTEEGEEDEEDEETETGGEDMCNDIDDVVLYLSPDDSNSMSSPAQVRDRILNAGDTYLSGINIRPWEFMNYYSFAYEPAPVDDLLVSAQMQPVDGDDTTYSLQIAVASELMGDADRPPMNVTLVLDTSGSMSGPPIELLRESSRVIAASLKVGDKVSIVEWDVENTWTLAGYSVSGPNDPMLLDKINEVVAGGGTDLNGGLTSGYELAQQTFDVDAINRIVLISDGGANAGITDLDLIAENAAYGGSDGIYLVGVGVDEGGTYNDDLMDAVTDAGKGASVFIDSNAEAQRIFGDDFVNTMAVAARDVQVELTMPPGFEIVKFSGEEFSDDPQEVEPQHIAPNDAMVFYQQIETCAPELIDVMTSELMVKASWVDAETFEAKEQTQIYTFEELMGFDDTLLIKGAAVLAYADGLKVYKKAGTDAQKAAALSPATDAVATARALLPEDDDLLEIETILYALQE